MLGIDYYRCKTSNTSLRNVFSTLFQARWFFYHKATLYAVVRSWQQNNFLRIVRGDRWNEQVDGIGWSVEQRRVAQVARQLSVGWSSGRYSRSVLANSRTLTGPGLTDEGTRTVSRGARVAVCPWLGCLPVRLFSLLTCASPLPGGHAYRARMRLTLTHGK